MAPGVSVMRRKEMRNRKKSAIVSLAISLIMLFGSVVTVPAAADTKPEDGTYTAAVVLEGGSGRASVDSPCVITVKDGEAMAEICWSSPNYDFMIVNGEKYEPVNKDELASADEDSGIGSIFEIPVTVMNEPFTVIADTTAMSEPHEIEYKLTLTLVKD